MYCDKCGKYIEKDNLYCSECGTKVNNINNVNLVNSNKTLWIIFGCIFGIIIIIPIIIFFLSFFIIVDNVKTVDENYTLEEYYDYESLNNSYIYNDDTEVIMVK